MDAADLYGNNPHMAPSRSRDSACPVAVCDGSVARARTSRLASQIPKKFRGVSFDRHPVTNMEPLFVRAVRQFCHGIDDHLDAGHSFGFFGDRGTGKTTLAMLITIEAMRQGRTVGVYTGPDLLTAIRSTYEDNSYMSLMESLLAVDLLHIEDLAVARPNEWVLEQLYTVINARYQDERSVVFTADVRAPELLGEHIGERSVSRLAEMCGERLIGIFGKDQRTTMQVAEPAGAESVAGSSSPELF
jgi:DNA replication protein DnaC